MNDRKRPRLPGLLRSAPYAVLLLLCAGVMTFGALFYLWQRYQFVRLGYEVEALRKSKARLEVQIEPLEVEAAYLSRMERIDALARGRLGMRAPSPAQVIVLEPDVPTTAFTR